PHGHHHRPAERPGGFGGDVRAVHGDVLAFVDVAQADAGFLQRGLERERAAQHEGDQVIAPEVRNVTHLLRQFAVAPYAVLRQVAADVDVLPQLGQSDLAWFADRKYRAGLGIALAKTQKITRQHLRQDHQVALDPSVGE